MNEFVRSLIVDVYETYKIVTVSEVPCELFTIEGIEMLVETNKLPREVATIIYKTMMRNKEKDND